MINNSTPYKIFVSIKSVSNVFIVPLRTEYTDLESCLRVSSYTFFMSSSLSEDGLFERLGL